MRYMELGGKRNGVSYCKDREQPRGIQPLRFLYILQTHFHSSSPFLSCGCPGKWNWVGTGRATRHRPACTSVHTNIETFLPHLFSSIALFNDADAVSRQHPNYFVAEF